MQALLSLAIQTVTNPAEAARVVNAVVLDRASLWSALVLACVLNVILQGISTLIFPVPVELAPLLGMAPMTMFVVYASFMIGFVYVLFWAGRAMGGTASFAAILTMMSWLQIMRAAVQAGSLLLMIAVPGLAGLFILAAGVYGVWVSMNFVNEAQEFNSLGKSLLLLILTGLGLALGLAVFLSFIGVTAAGF